MTEETYTPTFSHQPPAPRPSSTAAAAAELPSLLAIVEKILDESPDIQAREARKVALRQVWESLPDNARATRGELARRVAAARVRELAGSWWFDHPNLLLLGPTGAGKTSALALVVRRLLEEAVNAPRVLSPAERRHWRGCATSFDLAGLIRWQSCRELSRAVREHPLGQGAPDAIARCQNARLLVLDDIGATDEAGALERILNARYERGWPTLTCSGLTSRELSAAFGEALVRRLLQRKGQNGSVVSLFERGQS